MINEVVRHLMIKPAADISDKVTEDCTSNFSLNYPAAKFREIQTIHKYRLNFQKQSK